jgi:hypothetical protein
METKICRNLFSLKVSNFSFKYTLKKCISLSKICCIYTIIKPNLKTLGPRFGKDMGNIGKIITAFNQENIQDIEKARKNIQNIIEQGDDALKEMMDLAKQSESPRAFEVASTLMKTLLDANKDFVEMSTKKKYAVEEKNGPKEAAQTNVTNNNLILSTADLLKMIKGDIDG